MCIVFRINISCLPFVNYKILPVLKKKKLMTTSYSTLPRILQYIQQDTERKTTCEQSIVFEGPNFTRLKASTILWICCYRKIESSLVLDPTRKKFYLLTVCMSIVLTFPQLKSENRNNENPLQEHGSFLVVNIQHYFSNFYFLFLKLQLGLFYIIPVTKEQTGHVLHRYKRLQRVTKRFRKKKYINFHKI